MITAPGAVSAVVYYGTGTSYGSEMPVARFIGGQAQVRLGPLSAGTMYHYRVVATGPNGQAATQDATFTTPS